jgi:hypothetical protein
MRRQRPVIMVGFTNPFLHDVVNFVLSVPVFLLYRLHCLIQVTKAVRHDHKCRILSSR